MNLWKKRAPEGENRPHCNHAYNVLTFVLVFFQDGNFSRANVLPADPPPVKIVGQSSFVDFGENVDLSVVFVY